MKLTLQAEWIDNDPRVPNGAGEYDYSTLTIGGIHAVVYPSIDGFDWGVNGVSRGSGNAPTLDAAKVAAENAIIVAFALGVDA